MSDLNLKPISYTDKDISTILKGMVDQIPNLTNRWTDFSPSDVGMVILELLSWNLQMLSFYLDRQANEAFLTTARERKNVVNLCKLIAYRMTGVTSSTSVVQFSIETPAVSRIEIPKYTRILTEEDDVIEFATTSLAVIPTGDTSAIVGVRQGTPKTQNFRTAGTKNQRFRLSEIEVDSESIEVVINTVVWSQIDSFVNTQANDRVYLVEIDPEGNIDIVIGDNFFGYSPQTSNIDNVFITYLISNGDNGNVGIGAIKTPLGSFSDSLGNIVSLSVTNLQAATGGSSKETIEHAKKQAPAELSALFRAMTKSDFIALSEGYSGVGKALAWGEQEVSPPNYNLFNWVMVVIAPEGVTKEGLILDLSNGAPSNQLKTELLSYLYSRATITTRIKILDPSYVGIDFEANIYYKLGFSSSTIKSEVEASLIDFFSFENVEFGKEIRKSNLVRIMDSVIGVDYVEIIKFKRQEDISDVNDVVILQLYELPYLKTILLNVNKVTSVPPVPLVYPFPPAAPSPID